MPETSTEPEDQWLEEWCLVVDKTKYHLTPEQSAVVKKAIARGDKGMIMFPKFVISMPYIREFYREKRYINPKYQLKEIVENRPQSPEEARRARIAIEKIRNGVIKKIKKI
jgi:hypothetical protein